MRSRGPVEPTAAAVTNGRAETLEPRP